MNTGTQLEIPIASLLRTPRRHKRALPNGARGPSRRKSLFGAEPDDEEESDSDLSQISPLSRSSTEDEDSAPRVRGPGPKAKSPWKSPGKMSPNKCITPLKRNFDQLLIGKSMTSPRRSPRLKGVSPLAPDRGLIPPSMFYGKSSPSSDSRLVRRVRPLPLLKARSRLDFGDMPKDKKRPRTASGGPKRAKKRARREDDFRPILGRSLPKKKLCRTPQPVKRSITPPPRPSPSSPPKKLTTAWETLKFTRPVRKTTPKKFFTPPQKKRPLLDSTLDYLQSPDKEAPSPRKRRTSPRKKHPTTIVQEIREDFMAMVDEEEPDLRSQVEDLLRDLEDPPATPDKENEKTPVTTPSSVLKLFPIFTTSPRTMPSPKKTPRSSPKKKYLGTGSDQYQLDVGQRGLTEAICTICGMLYSQGDPEDEANHKAYHNNHQELKYYGWKKERVVGISDRDKILLVRPSDPDTWWNKIRHVLRIIDTELGFPEIPFGKIRTSSQIFLYVRNREIVGCLVAEVKATAHRLLDLEASVAVGIDVVSEESYPVKCGVSRLWVASLHRRTGVATKLLNALRLNFLYGSALGEDDLAFTVPTEQGKRFIAKYLKKTNYFVYSF